MMGAVRWVRYEGIAREQRFRRIERDIRSKRPRRKLRGAGAKLLPAWDGLAAQEALIVDLTQLFAQSETEYREPVDMGYIDIRAQLQAKGLVLRFAGDFGDREEFLAAICDAYKLANYEAAKPGPAQQLNRAYYRYVWRDTLARLYERYYPAYVLRTRRW